MKLHDFLEDAELNALRSKMGAHALGQFELFDPAKQLTYSEREALKTDGLNVTANELRVLKDKTLAYKNSRAWLKHGQHYHLANCPQVQQLRHQSTSLLLGTYLWPVSKDSALCVECLAVLQYQGIDSRRLRRTEFIEQIRQQFSLAEFQKQYPFYPLI